MVKMGTILEEKRREEKRREEKRREEKKLTASFLRAKQNISEMVDHRI